MKSSTMNRIKEIGIYRAIGVTKKNFIFKFMIETLVLISTTVLVGYLLSSGFIWMITSSSEALLEFIYYPWYVALILLGILYLVTLVCGLLPILSLLKKTPSEILAKYDI
jgi:ABC-type antimicrobial peptide transport system permease subunit